MFPFVPGGCARRLVQPIASLWCRLRRGSANISFPQSGPPAARAGAAAAVFGLHLRSAPLLPRVSVPADPQIEDLRAASWTAPLAGPDPVQRPLISILVQRIRPGMRRPGSASHSALLGAVALLPLRSLVIEASRSA